MSEQTRACKACGKPFKVGGRDGKKLSAAYCSRGCHQKSRYRLGTACKPLSDSDAGYIAGLFDGEGSVVLIRRANDSVGMFIDLCGVVREPIDWLLETTGVGNFHLRTSRSANHRRCYAWRAGGDAAESLLRKIVGLLKVKRRQAELAIAFQERLRTPALKADRTWQHEWRDKMKSLNARGAKAMT